MQRQLHCHAPIIIAPFPLGQKCISMHLYALILAVDSAAVGRDFDDVWPMVAPTAWRMIMANVSSYGEQIFAHTKCLINAAIAPRDNQTPGPMDSR